MHVPPTSGAVVAWCQAMLAGQVSPGRAARGIEGADVMHVVQRPDGLGSGTWAEALDWLGASGATGARLVLPVPGDPAGLAGPGTADVMAAGEAAVLLPAGPALVPEPQGSDTDPVVLWRAVPGVTLTEAARFGLDVAEADRQLRQAVLAAGEDLAALGLDRARPDATARLAAVDRALAGQDLPALPQRAVVLLRTAGRLLAVTAIAAEDDGAAVTAGEARARRAALDELARTCRRALEAGYGAGSSGVPADG